MQLCSCGASSIWLKRLRHVMWCWGKRNSGLERSGWQWVLWHVMAVHRDLWKAFNAHGALNRQLTWSLSQRHTRKDWADPRQNCCTFSLFFLPLSSTINKPVLEIKENNKFYFFLQKGTAANRVIWLALSAVRIFLSLTTVTVTAGNSVCEIVMSVLIFVSELAVIVNLFPIYTFMDD